MKVKNLKIEEKTEEKPVLGYINLANNITLLGLLLALACCFFALKGDLRASMTLLILAGICDLFDGVAARKSKRTDEEKAFGIQLDTLVDVINFGVAPAIVIFSIAGSIWYALVIYALYILCAVVRLAYFNTVATPDTAVSHYSGLPVTYIALILPLVLLFGSAPAGVIALGVTGLLFILNIKVPKPHGVWYVLFPLMAVALIVLWWRL